MKAPERSDITGLVLAGGQGSRMGGVDKGLQGWQGRPLVEHVIDRLRPQVGALMLNANRHLERYRAWGRPVWPDAEGGYPGPLAGFEAGLSHCPTDWMVTAPCDSPRLPDDLVPRLAAACAAAGADVALAATRDGLGALQPQPVFCLVRRSLLPSLQAFLATGQRRIDRWTATQAQVLVPFDDEAAFFNANTLEDLQP